MTKPLTSSSVADALAECYKNAGHWGSRREILSIRDGPLEKFFRYQIPCMNFFRPWHEYFLGLIGAWIFFHLIFTCANIFFVIYPPPNPPPHPTPHPTPITFLMARPLCHWDKMDFETLQNWLPGLTRYRLKIARHHPILHGRSSVFSAVSSRRMYFSGNCLISNILKKT